MRLWEERGRSNEWERILNFCLLQCESYLSISIKLQWRRVASAWGIVWDQLNLQVPANLMTLPKFNHATRAREDLTSTKWHAGVSTSTNWFLYEGLMIPGCLAQQDIKVLMCLLATDCPYKCCFHDIKWHLLIFFTCKKGHWIYYIVGFILNKDFSFVTTECISRRCSNVIKVCLQYLWLTALTHVSTLPLTDHKSSKD